VADSETKLNLQKDAQSQAKYIDTDRTQDLLARLNAEQVEAVRLGWGPALLIAGAGSGKTTVLTRRIAYLITNLNQDPHSIMAVTFTNKAAAEMKHRIENLVGFETARRISIGTFHSLCARILRQEISLYKSPEGWHWNNNFVIYDETDSLHVLKAQLTKLNLDEKVFVPKEIRHAISSLKNDGYSCSLYSRDARTYRETRLSEIYNAYQSALAQNNALDFDDLILIFTDLLKQNQEVLTRQRFRFRHIFVDEFQDTNKSQYELVHMIAQAPGKEFQLSFTESAHSDDPWHERSLMVVGDVDQSIYSWRKADFRIILGFQNDFKTAKLIKLEENYRSTSTILEVANSIIVNNTERIEKVLRCNRGKGAKVQCYEAQDEIDEAYYVVEELKRLKAREKPFADSVILYRTNAQSRAIEELLVRNHIPYTVVGATRFYDRQEIKDVIAYLKLIYNGQDGQAFKRIINVPKRGIGKTTIDKLSEYAEEQNISLLEAAAKANQTGDISPKTTKMLADFAMLVSRWQLAAQVSPVSDLLSLVLNDIKYIEKLEEDAGSSKDELALGRIENVRELQAVAKEFEQIADEPDLDSFLTRISLVSDLDSLAMEQDAVKLMTLHSAKGLEFPIVFLMGLEEGLFPHVRSLDSPTALEEERRLMYVGVTRAADLLYLTLARKRMLIGRGPSGNSFSTSYTIPSRFLREITPGLLAGYYPSPSRTESGYSESDDLESSSRFGSGSGSSFRQNSSQNSFSDRPARPRVLGQYQGTENGAVPRPEPEPQFEHLSIGDKVQHTKFGIGKVVQVIGEKDKELYNIEFESAGKRLLDPKFAKLIKIS
jgi:DNA helicase-2/ATP-dependent DNA helicase PcrA